MYAINDGQVDLNNCGFIMMIIEYIIEMMVLV